MQVSRGGGGTPRWSRDGREVVYVAADNRMMSVPLTFGADEHVASGTPVSLFTLRPTESFDVTRDGERFLVNMPIEDAPAPPITVVLNWKAPTPWL